MTIVRYEENGSSGGGAANVVCSDECANGMLVAAVLNEEFYSGTLEGCLNKLVDKLAVDMKVPKEILLGTAPRVMVKF